MVCSPLCTVIVNRLQAGSDSKARCIVAWLVSPGGLPRLAAKNIRPILLPRLIEAPSFRQIEIIVIQPELFWPKLANRDQMFHRDGAR